MRRPMRRAAIAGLLLASAGAAFAQAGGERTLVQAVADADQPRILVRWMSVEGTGRRHAIHDVLRRPAAGGAPVKLNAAPIGALTTAAAIEAVFTAPGRADALAAIVDGLGPDYAQAILEMQAPDAPGMAPMQKKLLPDLNYGVAMALGMGFLDETVTLGEPYVYEVWGLDAQGFRVERIGRATATAGSPPALSPVSGQSCVDLGDARSHMTAHLRWNEGAGAAGQYIAGYDLFRTLEPPGGCSTVAPGQAGVSRANRFPTFHQSPGRPGAGRTLYTATCASGSCHVAPGGVVDPRDLPPDPLTPAQNGVRGSTMGRYRNLQSAALAAPSLPVHDIAPLQALTPDQVQAIFEWIEEFEFLDDGAGAPGAPFAAGQTWCYAVLPRDLLGQHGPAPAAPAACRVDDRRPPSIPYGVRTARVAQAGGAWESCEISWDRNAASGDDTAVYEVARAAEMPRVGHPALTPVGPPVPQPASGDRIAHLDAGLGAADAGDDFFYAVRAVDAAGNAGDWSAFVPCVPRDLAAPPAAALTASCCPVDPRTGERPGLCEDRGLDSRWVGMGGDRTIVADPTRCPAQLTCGSGPDVFRCRLFRGFDDRPPLPGADFPPGQEVPADFAPMIDEKVVFQAQAFDTSGNRGPLSAPLHVLYLGQKPLPAPRIVQVSIAGTGNDHLRIRFRSLRPELLLGFALYKRHQDPDQDAPPDPVWEFATRFHDQNLGAQPYDPSPPPGEPVAWVVLGGAESLDERPSGIQPNPTGAFECPTVLPQDQTFLCYRPLEGIYVMQLPMPETHDLVLKLHAIGWSGREGLGLPYLWDGWTPGDGVLEWPLFRDDNRLTDAGQTALAATPGSAGPLHWFDLTWDAYPDGCLAGAAGPRPFVVFRRRQQAALWQQISPPFVCDAGNPALVYRDTDVQPGFSYIYTVIRLDQEGEFSVRFGPVSVTAP